jgi:cob(I)alamin adenosyltransferase
LYNRTGDRGETGLLGAKRVSKGSPRVDAYGEIDELNSCIGIAITKSGHEEITVTLKDIQRTLFVAGADLATELPKKGAKDPVIRIGKNQTETLERRTDELHSKLPRIANFILPGGSELAAQIHFARAVCRRAERRIVQLANREKINAENIQFFNRLSTYLFNLSRWANKQAGRKEDVWKG